MKFLNVVIFDFKVFPHLGKRITNSNVFEKFSHIAVANFEPIENASCKMDP
ncbi:hypothetical protein WG78_08765 [Amantichitinum ursilacus]|uniref:Uncharacterized protein n=1 Tax=Amantichitinum ursilacus TaxID=857265 RepID=A0A0N0XIY3_9NEIS|nr:hypothetical protein WG78_08765 [Amantichitinum ursilacus]